MSYIPRASFCVSQVIPMDAGTHVEATIEVSLKIGRTEFSGAFVHSMPTRDASLLPAVGKRWHARFEMDGQ